MNLRLYHCAYPASPRRSRDWVNHASRVAIPPCGCFGAGGFPTLTLRRRSQGPNAANGCLVALTRVNPENRGRSVRSPMRFSRYGLPDEKTQCRRNDKRQSRGPLCRIRVAACVGARVTRQDSPILRAGKDIIP